MASPDTYMMNRKVGSEQRNNVSRFVHSLFRAHINLNFYICFTQVFLKFFDDIGKILYVLCIFPMQDVRVCACVQARVSRWAQKAGGHSTLHHLVFHVWADRASEPHVYKQSCTRPSRIKFEQCLRWLLILFTVTQLEVPKATLSALVIQQQ